MQELSCKNSIPIMQKFSEKKERHTEVKSPYELLCKSSPVWNFKFGKFIFKYVFIVSFQKFARTNL